MTVDPVHRNAGQSIQVRIDAIAVRRMAVPDFAARRTSPARRRSRIE
jgi:hypothetical protein